MPRSDFNIEIGVDGNDQILAVMPPVDNAFREQIYDVLDETELIKEIVVRGGNFFETRQLPDGTAYSELRIDSTALTMTGQRMINIARQSAEVLQSLGHTAEVSPYIIPADSSQRLFEDR